MPKKVLIVTKDVMEFRLYSPVVPLLEAAGCEVVIVAEGLSMEHWIKSGREIYGGLPKTEDMDSNTKIRHDLVPSEVLSKLSPDLVMTGLADPIHLGQSFGLVANKIGKSLGFVEDLWFVHRRSSAIPDFICTPDEYGRRVIMKTKWHTELSPVISVYATGSPAMDVLADIKPDPETKSIVINSGARRVILIGGQDESTTPMLQGLAEALRKEKGWLIIPRFHPKWMVDASKAVHRDEWVKLIYEMEERHRVIWTPSWIDTRTLIPLATEVVSIYSNILLEAVALGVLAVSWTSDIGRQKMSEGLKGATRFPLVELGAAIEVSSAEDYLAKGHPRYYGPDAEQTPYFKEQARQILGLDGKASSRVAEAILSYVQ